MPIACFVSQDKDLRTVPGLLFNYRKNTDELITPGWALCNFYRQILVGDQTDNIVGCYRTGEKVAEREVTPDMSEAGMYHAVLAEFRKSLSRKGCPYADRTAEDVVLEFGRLRHMARTPGETSPPGYWKPPV